MKQDYSKYTDEEIIARCHRGEDQAVDYLLEKYKPLVRKKARALYLIGGDNDDLIQEGMIALYKAIREFDAGRQGSFSGFAGLCIEHQLYNVIKGANRKKNSPLNSYISLYSPTENVDENSSFRATLADTLQASELINPEDILIDQENVMDLEYAIEHNLSPFERNVVKLYMDGYNYQQIAEKLQKSPKSIDNALQRIKKKLNSIQSGR